MHGSAAVMSRFHPEYSLATLLSRSMALLVSKVLPRSAELEEEASKVKRKIEKAMASNPAKACGRQVYLTDLCKLAAGNYAVGPMPLHKIRKNIIEIS